MYITYIFLLHLTYKVCFLHLLVINFLLIIQRAVPYRLSLITLLKNLRLFVCASVCLGTSISFPKLIVLSIPNDFRLYRALASARAYPFFFQDIQPRICRSISQLNYLITHKSKSKSVFN